MRNRNLIIGVAAGAALISASLLLPKTSKYNFKNLGATANDALSGLKGRFGSSPEVNELSSAGEKLARKARHKAEQMLSSKMSQA